MKVTGGAGGAISDSKGEYTINVPDGGSLTFSYIGYSTQTVPVTGEKLDVTLRPDPKNQLSEVVVVGYGTQKRSDITGSVASVPKERLSKLPVNNVMQAIQGAVANVTVSQSSSIPGDPPSVQVRGRNSISAPSEPYIVVDGIPLSRTDGSINDINPNDIQSVEILKDPSAVAIYGVNGSNGVILITTKRGNTGKPSIRYSTYGGVENATDVLEVASGEEMLRRYAEYSRITKTSLYNGGPVRNRLEADNYQNGVTTDWLDAVMQTGVNQNHNVSVSGGSDNARYYISGDYLSQKGVVLGYDYKRYSFRLNTDIKTTKYLSIGTSSFIVGHNRDGGRANLLNATAMSPYATMFNPDGTLTQYPMATEQLWANPLLPTTLDPERRQFNMTLNGYGELAFGELWKPLTGLKYRLNGGFTYFPTRTNEYEGKTVYNATGLGRISNTESQTYTVENILSYNKDFGKHHIDFTGLFAAKDKYWQQAIATGQVFPNDDLAWGNLESASTQNISSEADRYRSVSQMGRINYGFNSKYMFTFTVRRDGASVFGANYKYGTFPSAAVAWNIHNESFLKQYADVVDQLKLRFSYGLTGNEAIGIYQTLSLMTAGSLAMGAQPRTSLKIRTVDGRLQMGNDNLQWEKTQGFNTGLDFGFLKNRLSGSVDFYKTQTRDLLLRQALPRVTGYEVVWSN
ncbi:MAG: SusC/RagA family TonB-linked outer membrane protein, partial [Pedobacter sp.]